MKNYPLNKHALFTAVFFLIILGTSYFLYCGFMKPAGNTAVISQDGKVLHKINLDLVTTEYEIAVEGKSGISNTVLVKHGEIMVISATCPDKVCVKTGAVRSGMLPIICLPNKLEIKITGTEAEVDGVVR